VLDKVPIVARRLWSNDCDLGQVSPWNSVIAGRYEAATERMLLGACGPARIVGSRRDEAIIAERERRAAAGTRRVSS
jgi:hypothetical protein